MNSNVIKTLLIVCSLNIGVNGFSKALNAKFRFTTNCRTVTFIDSSYGAISIDKYLWSFGDGAYSYTSSSAHTYKMNGTYSVLLIISSKDSSMGDYQDSAELQITINCNDCAINANFYYNKDLLIDNKINFTNTSDFQANFNSNWDFGYSGNGGSLLKNPTHVYPTSGYYNVKLKVSYYDSLASKYCADSIIINVQCKKLIARFSYTIDSANCRKINFYDSTTKTVDSVFWNFGDGQFSSKKNVTHQYAGNNSYFVMLWAYYYDSALGRNNVDTLDHWLVLTGCNSCLAVAYIELDGDSTKPFSGTLYNYSSGNINKHYWDFGDGGTSTQIAPLHSYAGPGSYTITYIAMDTIKNCSDTSRVSFKIDSLGYLKRQAFVLTVIDRTTSIESIPNTINDAIQIYPNPSQSQINLLSSYNQVVTIYDVLGTKIVSFEIHANVVEPMDVSNWSRGLYLMVGSKGETLKFILQ